MAGDGRIILDIDETEEVSHVIMLEVGESDSEIDLTETPEALEGFFPKKFL